MGGVLTLEDIKSAVEGSYPTPVASAFRRCRVANREDLGGRHKSLVDLFEVLIKFACIVQLQEARHVVPDLKGRLPQKEKTLEFLKRPSLGGWTGLLRILCGFEPGVAKPIWMPRISEWYNQRRNPENTAALSLLGDIDDVRFQKHSKTPNAEICNALVNYRNKQLVHAASLQDGELTRRLPILESVLAYLLKSASFLGDMTMFFTERVEVVENKQWKVHSLRLTGVIEEPACYVTTTQPELSEIYLTDRPEGTLERFPVPLCPFMIWQPNEELKRPEVYLYNDAWRTKLEYLSYSSGTYYYHKELHSRFSDLIDLKIKPGVEEDAYRSLSPEERAQRAEDLFKRAALLAERGRFEDALEMLEQSAEYERRSETLLEMAKVQRELGDPMESIRQTIQKCLDLDPANDAAQTMLANLNDSHKAARVSDDEGQAVSQTGEFPTFFHAVAPRAFGTSGWMFWAILVILWYSFSVVTECVAGRIPSAIALVFGALCALTLILGPVAFRLQMLRMRLPLSLQLSSMRLERFERWYDSQLLATFGLFVFRDGRLRLAESLKQQKVQYILWIAGTMLYTCTAFFTTAAYELPLPLLVKRCADLLVLFALWFPGVRAVVMVTVFVWRFSGLSLKPMLTKINDDGLRAFGPLLTLGVMVCAVAYGSYWIGAALITQMETRADFPFLALATLILMVWSVGLPVMIRRAARESKSNAVHAYSAHIEQAFKAFLDDPADDDKLATYQKLVKNQTVIRRIPTWPLSWKETVFVVLGSNLLLLALDAWYVVFRLGYWPAVVEYVRGLF